MSRTGSSWSRNRRLLRLVRPYRLGAVASIVSLLVGVGANLAGPALAQRAIDRGIYSHDHLVHDRARSRSGSARSSLAVLIGWAAMTVQTYSTSWVGRRVLSDLRIDLFAHIQRLELGYFERERAGRIISRLTNDVDALEELVTDGVTSTLRNTLILVGTASRSSCSTGGSRSPRSSCSRRWRPRRSSSACARRAPTASCASASPTSPPRSPRTSRASA